MSEPRRSNLAVASSAAIPIVLLLGMIFATGRGCGDTATDGGAPVPTPTPDPYNIMVTDADPTFSNLNADVKRLRIIVNVPPETPTVYVCGSLREMGNWAAKGKPLEGTGSERSVDFMLTRGTRVEFKFTLGSWEKEALLDDGTVPTNYVVEDLQENTALKFDIRHFGDRWNQPPPDLETAGIVGTADVMQNVASQYLDHDRHVIVWMPPGYAEDTARRYPVLYMHDGQNLFDPRSSATHVDWGVDETIGRLMADGKMEPMIVVGVFNSIDRQKEYSPWGRGPDYARFLIEELKPIVDKQYRTKRGPESTGVMGSSMGGLISLYLGWKHPDVFSGVGAVSTHFPWAAGRLIEDIRRGGEFPRSTRVYFDFGTETLDSTYEPYQDAMTEVFDGFGWKQPGDFIVYKAEGAAHIEAAWRERLHLPMMYLFGSDEAREEAIAIMRGEKADPYAALAAAGGETAANDAAPAGKSDATTAKSLQPEE